MASDALTTVRQQLREAGFTKRAGDIFTVDLTTDVIGWLGLNRATRHYRAGEFQVNPVVGVRHQLVERRVAELRDWKPHNYTPPTISTPVGYVMPEARYRGWVLSAEAPASTSADLVAAVTTYGCDFMRAHTDPVALLGAMDDGRALLCDYTRPVLLELLGRRDQALAAVENTLQARRDQQGQAAEEFREFAAAFRATA